MDFRIILNTELRNAGIIVEGSHAGIEFVILGFIAVIVVMAILDKYGDI